MNLCSSGVFFDKFGMSDVTVSIERLTIIVLAYSPSSTIYFMLYGIFSTYKSCFQNAKCTALSSLSNDA